MLRKTSAASSATGKTPPASSCSARRTPRIDGRFIHETMKAMSIEHFYSEERIPAPLGRRMAELAATELLK
ncbi:MAG: hypothetical protein R3F11_06440 [Verrucomicrobiales bacterium]